MENKVEIQKKLTSALMQFANISEQDAINLFGQGIVKAIPVHAFFIRDGVIPKTFGFVCSGLFRYMYTDREGKQYTKAFMPEQSFLSSYSAMIRQAPSFYAIEALEASVVLEFDYIKWLELKESNPCWDHFLIKMLEMGYSQKEKRERELLLLDSETRYRNFLEEYPTLETRVKQHMIASFLGIAPESLSRIRKKLNS
ncbi:MAG: Crp/Fnr family transcriptional regulator [Balneolaceae bacterium]|nr:Crp/Fnr family transcriptional regulator [Balneolaceae bacterium]